MGFGCMCLEVVFFRLCFYGVFYGPFCAKPHRNTFSVHRNTFSVLFCAKNCTDMKTEGTYEMMLGCGAHPKPMLSLQEFDFPAHSEGYCNNLESPGIQCCGNQIEDDLGKSVAILARPMEEMASLFIP
jgi:hypothetical protein